MPPPLVGGDGDVALLAERLDVELPRELVEELDPRCIALIACVEINSNTDQATDKACRRRLRRRRSNDGDAANSQAPLFLIAQHPNCTSWACSTHVAKPLSS